CWHWVGQLVGVLDSRMPLPHPQRLGPALVFPDSRHPGPRRLAGGLFRNADSDLAGSVLGLAHRGHALGSTIVANGGAENRHERFPKAEAGRRIRVVTPILFSTSLAHHGTTR